MENMTFRQWMQAVDRQVQAIAFLSVHDLADQPFHDWYNDGVEPEEAAQMTLEDEGFPF